MSSSVDTPRACPACTGATSDGRNDCRLCRGVGLVTADQAARWNAHNAHRVTSKLIAIEDRVRASLLRMADRPDLAALAREGMDLLGAHGNASQLPSGTADRHEAVKAYFHWQCAAERALGTPSKPPEKR